MCEREREKVREEESSSSGKREDGENKAVSIISFSFSSATQDPDRCGVEPKRLGVCTMSFNDVPFTIPLENLSDNQKNVKKKFWSTKNLIKNVTYFLEIGFY